MKYDTQEMAEVLCKTASVEYNSDLEKLLYHLDVQAQNPYNADFRRTVWLSLQKCVRSWKNDNVLSS